MLFGSVPALVSPKLLISSILMIFYSLFIVLRSKFRIIFNTFGANFLPSPDLTFLAHVYPPACGARGQEEGSLQGTGSLWTVLYNSQQDCVNCCCVVSVVDRKITIFENIN